MKNKYLIPIFVVLLVIGVFAIASFSNYPRGENLGDSITYHSNVCIYKNGELIECSHNLLTDAGKNLIKTILGDTGSGGPVQYIALCNATAGCSAPAAGDTTLDNEYTSCGLSRTQGTYGSLGTGNWSIAHTFTATCDNLETNMTGLFNQVSGGTLFAENTFTSVTLQTDDQLLVNWTIWVS